jgi:hypothetical protein
MAAEYRGRGEQNSKPEEIRILDRKTECWKELSRIADRRTAEYWTKRTLE